MRALDAVNEPFGQGWAQLTQFAIALVLSSTIGLEREIKQKAAGLRTYTVVGLGAALFTLVSKYGFSDVVRTGEVTLDPSRMAAQIVSGLGFIGAGVIFVQRGSIRGLTTAATIWLTAAVGAAAAAGLPVLAAAATAAYFFVGYALRPLTHRLPHLRTHSATYHLTYTQGSGLLRLLLALVTEEGFSVVELATARPEAPNIPGLQSTSENRAPDPAGSTAEVSVTVQGRGDLACLTDRLAQHPGVLACVVSPIDD